MGLHITKDVINLNSSSNSSSNSIFDDDLDSLIFMGFDQALGNSVSQSFPSSRYAKKLKVEDIHQHIYSF